MKTAEIQINYLRATQPIQNWKKTLNTLAIEKDKHSNGTKAYIFFDGSAILISSSYQSWISKNYY